MPGDEDNNWLSFNRDAGDNTKTVNLGHFDIKQYQIGRELVNGFDGLTAI